jgi:CheY-like chemotaxis protein
VLIVDDDVESLEITGAILEAAGASVVTAAAADEGLRALRARAFDAVLCDLGMPDVDGYGFIAAVRRDPAAGTRIRAIALSGYASPEDARRTVEAGFDRHVAKPVSPDVLVTIVVDLIAGR